MATDLARLAVSLELQQTQFQKGINQATASMKRMEKNTQSMSKGFTKMSGQLGSAAKQAIAFAGISFGASFLKGIIETNSALAKTADAVGLTVEGFQEFQYAAERAGVSQSQFASNMQAFVKRVGEAKAGTGPLVTALSKMDEQLLANITNSKNQDEALKALADAMQQADSATEKAALANAAFGRSGIGMVNVLKDGAAGLEQFSKEARDLGIIMNEDLVRAAERYDDQLLNINRRVQTTFGSAFLSLVTTVMDEAGNVFTAFFAAINKGWNYMKYGAEVAWNSIVAIFETGVGLALTPLRQALVALGNFSDKAKEIAANMPTITSGVENWQAKQKKLSDELDRSNQAIDDTVIAMFVYNAEQKQAREAADAYAAEQRKIANAAGAAGAAVSQSTEEMKAAAAEQKKVATEAAAFAASVQSLKDTLDPVGKAFTDYRANLTLLDTALARGVISGAEYSRMLGDLNQSFADLGEGGEIQKATDSAMTFSVALGTTLSNAVGGLADDFLDFTTGAQKSFSDFAASFLRQIAKMILQVTVFKTLSNSIGGFFNANANGNAYGPGGLIPFANGGIVNSPTLFGFRGGAGVMGESGPEAILPLSRGANGKLGVEGGGSTVVNVYNSSGSEATVNETTNSDGGRQIDIMINNAVDTALARGRHDNTLAASFGLRRRGA